MVAKRVDLGERNGYVEDVEENFYRVALYTRKGWQHYRFPKEFSNEELREKTPIKCHVIEDSGELRLSIEKVSGEKIDEEALERQLEEIAYERWQELEEMARKRGWGKIK